MTRGATLRMALRALLRNKTRSALTALGIVIGVAAVIATMALGAGAQARVADAFAAMGTNLLVVFPGSFTSGGARGGAGSASTVTWEDLRAIRTEIPSVQTAGPELRAAAQLVSEGSNWNAQVVVLGRTTADELFGAGVDPLGELVRIRNAPFLVVGVLERKGKSAMGQDQDDTAIVPATTFQARIQGRVSSSIGGVVLVSAVSADATANAQEEIAALLRERHHLEPGAEDDFSVGNLSEVADSQQQSARTIALLLASIAAGVAISAQLARSFGWATRVDPTTVLLAFGFSAAVGIAFGLYPAVRASRLDPIAALRYE